MFKLSQLLGILSFQLKREITNLAIIALEILEKERDKRKKLEVLLMQAGFEDEQLFGAEKDYLINRKSIWDKFNNMSRQSAELITKFNIQNDEK